jgi:hypothetical protein
MPEAPADDAKYLKLATLITASRTVFERLYDNLIDPHIVKRQLQQFKTIARFRDHDKPGLTGSAKDQADFAEALKRLDRAKLLADLFSRHLGQLFSEQQDAAVALQSVLNVKEMFQNPKNVNLWSAATMRRSCRIECKIENDQPERGSGFLIGPNLVLTNWHVMKSQIDPATGVAKKDSGRAITIIFDYLRLADGNVSAGARFRVVRDWLVKASPAHPHETAAVAQGDEPFPAQPDELANNLDFAIIEVDGTPGYERGWYTLDRTVWPTHANAMFVYQFPLGRAMAVTPGKFEAPTVFQDNKKPPRILHTANTVSGSSGGLCVDFAGAPIALHQAGWKLKDGVDEEGNPAKLASLNAAIPLAQVAAVAGDEVELRIRNAPKLVTMTTKGCPIIGRSKFQSLVAGARRGDLRIVTVQTSPDPQTALPRTKIGKSFSATIIETLVDEQRVVVVVKAGRLTTNAYQAAHEIVERAHPASLATIPTTSDQQTSLDAEAAGRLVKPVIDALRKAAGNGVLWLVIDDLDRSPILSESPTSTFLSALYLAVAADPSLRVALIGPTRRLSELDGLPFDSDTLEEHVDDNDVAAWITTERGRDRPLPVDLGLVFVDIARSVAQELAKDPDRGRTGAVAHVLKEHVVEAIRKK